MSSQTQTAARSSHELDAPVTPPRHNAAPRRGARHTLGVYAREAAYQFRGVVRMPAFALPSLAFPAMFYLFFGAMFGGRDQSTYMLASLGTFGIMGPALFGFGVNVAMDRERGVLALKRVFPLPPAAYFCARLAMSALFALIIITLLSILAAALGGVALPRTHWFALAGVLVIGTIPFCALGLTIGLFVGGKASTAVVQLIYLPMSFLPGLWIPINMLPHGLQQFASALPAYHLGQLALMVVGFGHGNIWVTVHPPARLLSARAYAKANAVVRRRSAVSRIVA